MDIAHLLLDFILHVDVHLAQFVADYGLWVYALLFLIIFVETGLVVMPFLPGDSLLFVVGALCGTGHMSLPVVIALLVSAAVIGDQVNYSIGRKLGPKVFKWDQSRWFNRKAFDAAHQFYERHGGITIMAARFMPFFRTFTPFVAGVAEMTRTKFTFFSVLGGIIWVVSLTVAGYLFGNIDWVKTHLSKIILAMIIIPGVVVIVGSLRARRASAG
jgi:membrane-associated protein